jgi:hypothetical protein
VRKDWREAWGFLAPPALSLAGVRFQPHATFACADVPKNPMRASKPGEREVRLIAGRQRVNSQAFILMPCEPPKESSADGASRHGHVHCAGRAPIDSQDGRRDAPARAQPRRSFEPVIISTKLQPLFLRQPAPTQTISFSLARQTAIATFCRSASALVLSHRGESAAIAALDVTRTNATGAAPRQRDRRFTIIASRAHTPARGHSRSATPHSGLGWVAGPTQ